MPPSNDTASSSGPRSRSGCMACRQQLGRFQDGMDSKMEACGLDYRQRMLVFHFFDQLREQVMAVLPISLLLVFVIGAFFQQSTDNPGQQAYGLFCAIFGLLFFMEGLRVVVMPLAQTVGSRLPLKYPLPVVLLVAGCLGILVTYAEPAIASLSPLAQLVDKTRAPYLYYALNDQREMLVLSIGLGVGMAAVVGTLRFVKGWSIKPIIYISLVPTIGLACYMQWGNPDLAPLLGLAWDCGAVTTGPVTVPILLALGIGVMSSQRQKRLARAALQNAVDTNTGQTLEGFGVVTLASVFPVLAVEVMGIMISLTITKEDIIANSKSSVSTSPADQSPIREVVFGIRAIMPLIVALVLLVLLVLREPLPHLTAYTVGGGGGAADEDVSASKQGGGGGAAAAAEGSGHLAPTKQAADGSSGGGAGGGEREGRSGRRGRLATESSSCSTTTTTTATAANGDWRSGSSEQSSRLPSGYDSEYGGGRDAAGGDGSAAGAPTDVVVVAAGLGECGGALAAAVGPGSGEDAAKGGGEGAVMAWTPKKAAAAAAGGFEGGGDGGGSVVVVMDGEKAAAVPPRPWYIRYGGLIVGVVLAQGGMIMFNIGLTYGFTALGNQAGTLLPAAYLQIQGEPKSPYYDYVGGIVLVMVVAFTLGFLATRAEPALRVMGATVQHLSGGAFSAAMLIYAVSVGVGSGMAVGSTKILFGVPLIYIILVKYAIAVTITIFSDESFTNVAWDSAGVTTGPVTVPFVLSLGIGFSKATQATEGFGILTAASVAPIISVLLTNMLKAPAKTFVRHLSRLSTQSRAGALSKSDRGSSLAAMSRRAKRHKDTASALSAVAAINAEAARLEDAPSTPTAPSLSAGPSLAASSSPAAGEEAGYPPPPPPPAAGRR